MILLEGFIFSKHTNCPPNDIQQVLMN